MKYPSLLEELHTWQKELYNISSKGQGTLLGKTLVNLIKVYSVKVERYS